MGERKIDALVMQNSNDWLGGYVKWFTDLPANNGYPRAVVFHADAPMSVVDSVCVIVESASWLMPTSNHCAIFSRAGFSGTAKSHRANAPFASLPI